MTTFLAIETSSPTPGIAIARDGELLFDSLRQPWAGAIDVASAAALALKAAGLTAREIDVIGVNMGPGGLGVIRAGVSFANALAFSTDTPLYAFTYFEIAGAQLAGTDLPVVCVLSAAGTDAYVALSRDGVLQAGRFGDPAVLLPGMAQGLDRITTAGRLRSRVAAILPDVEVEDSGVDAPDPKIILDLARARHAQGAPTAAPAEPLNELAAVFHD
jgi:tRNA threonylcarbamoyl adenosine modification protein YeaZ